MLDAGVVRSIFVMVADVLRERKLNSCLPERDISGKCQNWKEMSSSTGMLFSDMKANSKSNGRKSWNYCLGAGVLGRKGEQERKCVSIVSINTNNFCRTNYILESLLCFVTITLNMRQKADLYFNINHKFGSVLGNQQQGKGRSLFVMFQAHNSLTAASQSS